MVLNIAEIGETLKVLRPPGAEKGSGQTDKVDEIVHFYIFFESTV